jgi:two-component system chemotaxis response regulator CheB
VVDDSAVVRGLISRILDAEPGISVLASASNGEMALSLLSRVPGIDVVILDIEMPVMDGLAALPALLARNPGVKVIMASTLTQRNAEISLKALAAGASDYLPKPSSRQIIAGGGFPRELVAKVRALGPRRQGSAEALAAVASRNPTGDLAAAAANGASASGRQPTEGAIRHLSGHLSGHSSGKSIVLRPQGLSRPEVIAIGCSTGGPQALGRLMGALAPGVLRQPILVTQHMPPMFTAILAQHLERSSGWPCREAEDGEPVLGARLYIAPGDRHMLVERDAGSVRIRITQDPPENYCRPSVDPMFRALAQVYGARTLAVMLTGMGSDGCKGAASLVEAGSTLIAQDEASSVVWGMPGAVAHAGLCSQVLPLDELAGCILRIAGGSRP